MQTLCTLYTRFFDIVQTLNRHYADYHTRVHLAHFSVVISGKFPYCAMVFAGPTWRQRAGSVLVASRRFDGSRSRKTKGSLADTLQCNIWRRAQTLEDCWCGREVLLSRVRVKLDKKDGDGRSVRMDCDTAMIECLYGLLRAGAHALGVPLVCRIKSAVCILSALCVHTMCIKSQFKCAD